MTARFKEKVPVMNEAGELLMFDLSDFPHESLIGEKDGKNGPIEFYHATPGMKVVAIDEKTGLPVWAEVSGWSKHTDRLIEVVTLKSGRQIITDDDERAVYGFECGTTKYTRNTPSKAVETKMFVPTFKKLENLESSSLEGNQEDFELGYIYGSLAGNGWVETKYNSISGNVFLSNIDPSVGEGFLEYSKRVFEYKGKDLKYYRPKNSQNSYSEAFKYGFCNQEAAITISRNIGLGARNKHLPLGFIGKSKQYKLGLLAGLMDNDGSISVSFAKNKPQLMANYSSVSIRLIQEVQFLLSDLGIKSKITPSRTPAGEPFWHLGISSVDVKRWNGYGMLHTEKLTKLHSTEVAAGSAVVAKYDIVPISFEMANLITKAIQAPRTAPAEQKSCYTVFAKAKKCGSVSRITANNLTKIVPMEILEQISGFKEWFSLAQNTDVYWDQVESMIKTDIRETGYDLTVPGYETFMSVDGVILSNTMLVTAPISDEANREAEKMLPSKNLYQPGTGKLMVMPEHEALTGLYYLSKNKKGLEQINGVLGGKFHVSETLNKGSLNKLLNKISHEVDGGEFARIVFGLKNLGETHAYEKGFTVGINDLTQFSKERDAIYNHIAQKAKGASQEELSKLSKAANGLIDKVMSDKLKDKDNPLYDQIDAGSRGSISNLRALMISPMFINDARNRVVPTPIRKSYTEGLDMHDYWTSMYGARKGMMDRAIQTALPGTVSKDIMATTIDNVISKDDCGTHKGISTPCESSDIIDRYLAGDQHGFKHNTLINSRVQRELISHGVKTVVVRSPITCLQPKGTCAHCFGLDEHGTNPTVGENVGAKMGQTMSEPLVQLVMNCSDGHVYNEQGEAIPFIDYYDSFDYQEIDDGHCLSKQINTTVLDSTSDQVNTFCAQKHMPDDDMLFIKTKNGKTLLVQANHPLWAYLDENGDNRIEVSAEDLTKDMFLKTIDAKTGNNDCPINPYFVGRYLSDGSTRYGNGTKKYEGVAVATIITGADVDIQKKTASCIEGSSVRPVDVQIYNPDFANKMRNLVKGKEAKLKRLSAGFNLWKKEDLENVLAGFIDGDSSCFIKNNTTVAQVYTSSFYILQQIEIICNILKVKFSSTVVPREPLQKSPAFTGQIRFYNDSIYKKSVKLSRIAFMPASYEYKSIQFDKVKYIKRLWAWDLEVYDIKTGTKSFVCGLVENHNTFHTGGAAGTGAKASGYKRIDQLLSMPKNLAGSATLASLKGKITRITDGLGGGYDVFIGTEKHHIAQGNELVVKVGDSVEPGDRLSTGPIKPQELVEHKGMKAAQEYIVNELHSEYKDQGQSLHKKVFETVVRSLTNTTKILNKPKGTPFLPGDIAPYSVVMHHNENLERDIPVGEALGCHLATAVGGLRVGHELTQLEVNSLEKAGVKTVRVKFEEIEHKPFIKGITSQPMLKKDWMSALGYRDLKKAIVEGAGKSWETDTSGYHPIPAFAKGITFGKGSDGRY